MKRNYKQRQRRNQNRVKKCSQNTNNTQDTGKYYIFISLKSKEKEPDYWTEEMTQCNGQWMFCKNKVKEADFEVMYSKNFE